MKFVKLILKDYKLVAVISIISLITILASTYTFIPKKDITQPENTTVTDSTLKDNDEATKDVSIANASSVPMLCYHSVDPSEANEIIISPEKLKNQLMLIKSLGYNTITIDELNDYLTSNKTIPEKSIVISFDDGYMDNYTYAFPILKELNMKATIFLITSGIDDGYYLSSDQIKEMASYGIDFESHTVSHKKLDTLTYEEQLSELKNSKITLENLLNKKINTIAYPFGAYNEDTIKAAKEANYTLAFTTKYGNIHIGDSLLELNRIYVNTYDTMDKFKERLLNSK